MAVKASTKYLMWLSFYKYPNAVISADIPSLLTHPLAQQYLATRCVCTAISSSVRTGLEVDAELLDTSPPCPSASCALDKCLS